MNKYIHTDPRHKLTLPIRYNMWLVQSLALICILLEMKPHPFHYLQCHWFTTQVLICIFSKVALHAISGFPGKEVRGQADIRQGLWVALCGCECDGKGRASAGRPRITGDIGNGNGVSRWPWMKKEQTQFGRRIRAEKNKKSKEQKHHVLLEDDGQNISNKKSKVLLQAEKQKKIKRRKPVCWLSQ